MHENQDKSKQQSTLKITHMDSKEIVVQNQERFTGKISPGQPKTEVKGLHGHPQTWPH